MKAIVYTIVFLIVLFTNELSAQKNFQKRKYTKGIFSETIKKVRSKKGKDQVVKVTCVKSSEAVIQPIVVSDSSLNKNPEPIELIQLPLEKLTVVEEKTPVSNRKQNHVTKLNDDSNTKTLMVSIEKTSVAPTQRAIVNEHAIANHSNYNTPDESFLSHVFGGGFWETLGIIFLVLAGISLLAGLLLLALAINSPWFYISLGIIALGSIVYLIIDNSPKKDTEAGEKVLVFLEKMGTPILSVLCALAAAMTRV